MKGTKVAHGIIQTPELTCLFYSQQPSTQEPVNQSITVDAMANLFYKMSMWEVKRKQEKQESTVVFKQKVTKLCSGWFMVAAIFSLW